MPHAHLIRLQMFVQHPLTQLCVGLILFGTGMTEIVDDLISTRQSFKIGVHHGVVVLGLMQVLQNIPPLIDGLERWLDSVEKKDEKSRGD